ncbi:MAG: hypothetical protein ACI92I_000921 [Acidimicrobiales bacterium]|jgi:hypothetical protein
MFIYVAGKNRELVAARLTDIFPEHCISVLEAPIVWNLRTLQCDVLVYEDVSNDHAPVDMLLCRLNEMYPELVKIIRKRSTFWQESYNTDVKPWLRTIIDDPRKPITRDRYLALFAQGEAEHQRELLEANQQKGRGKTFRQRFIKAHQFPIRF